MCVPCKLNAGLMLAVLSVSISSGVAQVQTPNPSVLLAKPSGTVEKLPDGSYRVGTLRVDTAKREVGAPATVNDVTILEWVANTRDGSKAYESLLTVDTDAISFNAALLLIGLDPARARLPKQHFDPEPPRGDPVELLLEVKHPSVRRIPIEDLLLDQRTGRTLPVGPWVYTGSMFVDGPNGPGGRRYLADLDGVLVGFVHSPAPIIENPRTGAVNAYGAVVVNGQAGLPAGSPVTLVVRALPRGERAR